MGLLALQRLMSMQRDRHHQHMQPPNGLITSLAKRKELICLQEGKPPGGKKLRRLGPNLPEEIWGHIHSLLSLRDAARAACVSHTFRSSWRCHPNLIFSKETLVLDGNLHREDKTSDKISSDLVWKIDHILKNHSGIGVKALRIEIYDVANINTCYLYNWLCLAVKPGLEELALLLDYDAAYNFPWSVFLEGRANSIRDLHLTCCVLRPTAGFSCLRSLTSLKLCDVYITGDELGCLLSCSFALEELKLTSCDEIICLKIPRVLQRLRHLVVHECENLEAIKSKAPNLSNFEYTGGVVKLSFGDALRNLRITGFGCNLVHYACAKLPQMVPYLEALDITSSLERKISVLPGKFFHLKHLSISFMASSRESFCPDYDYFSLVYLLDACPSLETFMLSVTQDSVEHDSVIGDSSQLRQMPGHCHGSIKDVTIIGFSSAKSMVELTCHILENAMSLECLTLDTVCYDFRCCDGTSECAPVTKDMIMEAHKALLVVKSYLLEKVPSTVEFNVVEPCSRCTLVEI